MYICISNTSNSVFYADDTSFIITNSDTQMFGKYITTDILQISNCFYSNLLWLNLAKTYILQFKTKNSNVTNFHISHVNKLMSSIHNIKFLWLMIDTSIAMLNKQYLNTASYLITFLKLLISWIIKDGLLLINSFNYIVWYYNLGYIDTLSRNHERTI